MSESHPARQTVGHVMPEYLPRAATYIYTTLLFQRRFDSIVLTPQTANVEEFPLDAPLVRLTTPGSPSPGPIANRLLQWRLASGIARGSRRYRCVALHAHHGWSGPASLKAQRKLGIPLLTTFYGRDLSRPKRRSELRHPYVRLFRDGTLFLCEGPAMQAKLHALGCPEDRTRIVKIALDLTRFPFGPAARTGPLILLQIARFVEKKGIDLSIRSFAEARRRDLGPSELWLVGDGDLRPELEDLATRLGVQGSVNFYGERPHNECISLCRRAHVLIQPSRTASDGDTEGGAPTVLLEAQAMGMQVVATRHADIPNIVAAQDSLVDEDDVEGLAEAILHLSRMSESEWQKRALRGRSYVEQEHDASKVAEQLSSLYAEAIVLSETGK